MRLSRATDTPFWILTLRRPTMLLSGDNTGVTRKPANADQPSSWYKKMEATVISKGAAVKQMVSLAHMQERRSRTGVKEVELVDQV